MASKPARRRSERRRQPRAEARLSMRVEGGHEGNSAQVVTESQNISASGVYCTSSHFMAPLSKVQLTLVLPRLPGRSAQELVKCEGIVVRCDVIERRGNPSYELACMFSDLDVPRRALIDEFVTWRNLQSLRAAARATDKRRRTSPTSRVARAASAAGKRAAKPAARRTNGAATRRATVSSSRRRTGSGRS
jgi:PilZ domain